MTESLGSPGMVLAIVLAEIAAGGAAVLWAAPLWGRARPAFFKLTGGVLAVCAALAWLSARAPLRTVGDDGRAAAVALAISGGVAFLWQVLLWVGLRRASRAAGLAVIPASLGALVAVGLIPADGGPVALRIFQLVAGAAFAGAAVIGLLLGHWYLVDRRLARDPLRIVNDVFLAACALVAAGAIAGGGPGEATPQYSPLLGVGFLTVALAVGLVALCALMAFLIRRLIKENSLQAATGFFYLAVILGLAAEFAAKVGFF